MSQESFKVRIDAEDVGRRLQTLRHIKDGAERATMRAMNRTVIGMRTDAAKEVSSRYHVKQKDVKPKLNVYRASLSNLTVALGSRGRPMRLASFTRTKRNKRPGRKGAPTAFANVKRANSGARIRGAFFANFQAGQNTHEGIFVRTGRFAMVKRGRYAGRVREGIRQLHGPGVMQMLDNENTRTAIQDKALVRFDRELDHQVDHLLKEADKK